MKYPAGLYYNPESNQLIEWEIREGLYNFGVVWLGCEVFDRRFLGTPIRFAQFVDKIINQGFVFIGRVT